MYGINIGKAGKKLSPFLISGCIPGKVFLAEKPIYQFTWGNIVPLTGPQQPDRKRGADHNKCPQTGKGGRFMEQGGI